VDNARNGLRVTAGTISWDHGTVSGNGQEGIYASTPSATLYDHLTVDNNAAFGLRIQGTTTKGTLRNSTVTHNTLGGIWLVNAAFDVTSNHLKYNGYGLYLEGPSSGAVTLNDVLYNERDGVFACFNSSGAPTTTVKSNNIYGNATVDGSILEMVSVSVATTAGYYGTSSSTTTYSTGGPLVAFVKGAYTETDAGWVEGGLYASSGSALVTWSAAAAGWYDVRAFGTTSILAKVVDGQGSSYYGSASATRVLYVTQATSPARFVEMAAVLQSGSIDATANYWGTFPDVPSRVVEAENGTINYTGFKSVPVAGTGPQ
jgi:parallel beta-helix repeat protein